MGDRNLYEEIEIPPMRAAAPRETERRVPVTEFSQVAQMAFRGFTHLNRIQSIMFATVCMGLARGLARPGVTGSAVI
jgi:hypothetical protein